MPRDYFLAVSQVRFRPGSEQCSALLRVVFWLVSRFWHKFFSWNCFARVVWCYLKSNWWGPPRLLQECAVEHQFRVGAGIHRPKDLSAHALLHHVVTYYTMLHLQFHVYFCLRHNPSKYRGKWENHKYFPSPKDWPGGLGAPESMAFMVPRQPGLARSVHLSIDYGSISWWGPTQQRTLCWGLWRSRHDL